MKERPIIFSPEMVIAILDGRKTQTRRVIKPQPSKYIDGEPHWNIGGYRLRKEVSNPLPRPYNIGDRMWVRESFAVGKGYDWLKPGLMPWERCALRKWYKADQEQIDLESRGRWRPSIHMPRWASRITLEITNVRVERVRDISTADIYKEGITDTYPGCSERLGGRQEYLNREFANLWNSINEKRGFGWDVNPWVWVVEFKVCDD